MGLEVGADMAVGRNGCDRAVIPRQGSKATYTPARDRQSLIDIDTARNRTRVRQRRRDHARTINRVRAADKAAIVKRTKCT